MITELKRYSAIALAVAILLLPHASSTSLIDRSIGEVYADSDVVLLGTLARVEASCDSSTCDPIKYTVDIQSVTKWLASTNERHSSKTLAFCSSAPLALGNAYFLFLRNASTWRKIDGCNLEATHDAIFMQMQDGAAYRLWANDSAEVIDHKGNTYLTYGIKFPKFLSQLEAAEKGNPGP